MPRYQKYDLFTLDLFVRVCDARSLSRVAEEVNIAGSAISRRIALLEHETGLSLLTRRPHGMEPTPAGTIMLRYARDYLHLGQQMDAALEDFRSGASGHIRLIASSSALVECLANHLSAFSERYERIKIDLEERPSAETVDALRRKQADVGVIVTGDPLPDLVSVDYASDRLAVAVPMHHRLARHSSLSFADLLDEDHVALEQGTAVHRLLVDKAKGYQNPPRMRVQVRSFEVMCQMIGRGLGIGIMPHRAVGPLADALGLTLVTLDEPWARRHFSICTASNEATSPSARLLVEFLRESAAAGGA